MWDAARAFCSTVTMIATKGPRYSAGNLRVVGVTDTVDQCRDAVEAVAATKHHSPVAGHTATCVTVCDVSLKTARTWLAVMHALPGAHAPT